MATTFEVFEVVLSNGVNENLWIIVAMNATIAERNTLEEAAERVQLGREYKQRCGNPADELLDYKVVSVRYVDMPSTLFCDDIKINKPVLMGSKKVKKKFLTFCSSVVSSSM